MCVDRQGDGGSGGEHEQEEDDDEPSAATVGADQRLVHGNHLLWRQSEKTRDHTVVSQINAWSMVTICCGGKARGHEITREFHVHTVRCKHIHTVMPRAFV